MTLEILKDQQELRNLIDNYAYLGDEKKLSQQMALFTKDATYQVYMGDMMVSNVSDTDNLENEFAGHAAQVKTYFTLNGQHTVKIAGNTATGISFSQIKMVRATGDGDIITDYSVRYNDSYVRLNGKWLIKERVAYFIVADARPLKH